MNFLSKGFPLTFEAILLRCLESCPIHFKYTAQFLCYLVNPLKTFAFQSHFFSLGVKKFAGIRSGK